MPTTNEPGPIVDAYAGWDDSGSAFRVYLVREDTEDGATFANLDHARPMRAVHGVDPLDDAVEARLYKAAFLRCAKDIAHLSAGTRELGWDREPPAKRVAAAVKKELAAIAKGKPGPTDDAIRLVLALLPRKGAGR